MRTPWKLALVSALVLTALFGASSPAAANHTGTVTVETTVATNNLVLAIDQYRGYTFNLGLGESITYAVQTITPSLARFDVYFFDAAGLATYRANPPATSQALRSLPDDSQFGGTFTSASGAITVIIDNVNGTGASPTGSITIQVGISSNGGAPPPDAFAFLAVGLAICVGLIILVVVVIVLIIYFVTRQKSPPLPPPQPPYMPPPQQPWPPQQPPQPPGQYPGNP